MLSYFTRGNGQRKTILLHGFLGSGRNLGSLAARWAERDAALTLIVPDQLGHGASPPLSAAPSLGELANAVVELQKSLSAEEAPIVGHSLGGRVALLAATARTAKVTLLDVSASPICLTDGLDVVFDTLMQAPDSAENRQTMRDYFLQNGVAPALTDWALMNFTATPDGFRWRIDRQALAKMNSDSCARDLWPEVERWRDKMRVIRGGDSHFVSDEDATRFSRLGLRVDTLLGAGHFLHIDQPDALLALLTR